MMRSRGEQMTTLLRGTQTVQEAQSVDSDVCIVWDNLCLVSTLCACR